MQELTIWLVYLTWTTSLLAQIPKDKLPLNPHLGSANNADYLSKRCKMAPKSRVQLDEKAQIALSDQVGIECLKGNGGA